MKRFNEPTMSIQMLDKGDLLCTSDCMTEALNCVECYCSAVTCEGVHTCDGFKCTPMYDLL